MTNAVPFISALRSNHDRLIALASGLDEQSVQAQSYADEWSIAQVFSHLGSGAELGLRWLEAALVRGDAPGREENEAVWDVWNARSPVDQMQQCLVADDAYVSRFESLSQSELDGAFIDLFGMFKLDGTGLASFRLPEAAVHAWDIAVAVDPAARIAADATALMIAGLPDRNWGTKPRPANWNLLVEASEPKCMFVLRNAPESVVLEAAEPPSDGLDGTLRITSEAYIRLAFGRLDDDNADGAKLESDVITMEDLRAVYPGF